MGDRSCTEPWPSRSGPLMYRRPRQSAVTAINTDKCITDNAVCNTTWLHLLFVYVSNITPAYSTRAGTFIPRSVYRACSFWLQATMIHPISTAGLFRTLGNIRANTWHDTKTLRTHVQMLKNWLIEEPLICLHQGIWIQMRPESSYWQSGYQLHAEFHVTRDIATRKHPIITS